MGVAVPRLKTTALAVYVALIFLNIESSQMIAVCANKAFVSLSLHLENVQ